MKQATTTSIAVWLSVLLLGTTSCEVVRQQETPPAQSSRGTSAAEGSVASSGVKPDSPSVEGADANPLASIAMLERVQSRLTLAAYKYAFGASKFTGSESLSIADNGCSQFLLWPMHEDGTGWRVRANNGADVSTPYVEFLSESVVPELRVVTVQGDDSDSAKADDSRPTSNDPGMQASMENRERISRLMKQVLLPVGAYHVLFRKYPESPAEAFRTLSFGIVSVPAEALIAEVERIQFMRSASGDKVGLVAYPKANAQPILVLHEDPDFTLITPTGAQFLHDASETDRLIASLEVWTDLDFSQFPTLTNSPCDP